MVEKYNITRAKKYNDKQTGEEKTSWQNVGYITLFTKPDGSKSGLCEIPALGQEFQVFVQKDRDSAGGGYSQPSQPSQGSQSDEVSVEDIKW